MKRGTKVRFFLIGLFLFTFQTAAEQKKGNQIGVEKNACIKEPFNREFTDGDGSAEKPYVICNIYQLQKINRDRDAHYILGKNIDASSSRSDSMDGFTPIEKFSGELNGNGFKISNLYVKGLSQLTAGRGESDRLSVGLFRVVSSGARFKNLALQDLTFYMNEAKGVIIGGLAGKIEVDGSDTIIIENSSVSGTMVLAGKNNSFSKVGGLIGKINIEDTHIIFLLGEKGPIFIKNSSVSGTIDLSDKSNSVVQIGGLIGVVEAVGGEIDITDSYVKADMDLHLETKQKYVGFGGLIGGISLSENNRSKVRNCFVQGRINFSGKNITRINNMGELVSDIFLEKESYLEIVDSYVETDVTSHFEKGYPAMGRLAGSILVESSSRFDLKNYVAQGEARFSISDGIVPYVGGLAGVTTIKEGGSVKIVNSRKEGLMTFSMINNHGLKIGGLIGQLFIEDGHIESGRNSVNGTMTLLDDNNSESVMAGLFGQVEMRKGSVKVIDNIIESMIISGGSYNFRLGGLIGVISLSLENTSTFGEKRATIAKGHIEIKDSYVQNEGKDYPPIMNLIYDGRMKCPRAEWMNSHKKGEPYHLIMTGGERSNECFFQVELH